MSQEQVGGVEMLRIAIESELNLVKIQDMTVQLLTLIIFTTVVGFVECINGVVITTEIGVK